MSAYYADVNSDIKFRPNDKVYITTNGARESEAGGPSNIYLYCHSSGEYTLLRSIWNGLAGWKEREGLISRGRKISSSRWDHLCEKKFTRHVFQSPKLVGRERRSSSASLVWKFDMELRFVMTLVLLRKSWLRPSRPCCLRPVDQRPRCQLVQEHGQDYQA